jgi:4-aminobutyrate aminotransferase-like enzyme
MTEALRRLSEADEMKSLIAEARGSGKSVAIEVFQSREGQPILIHFTKENA